MAAPAPTTNPASKKNIKISTAVFVLSSKKGKGTGALSGDRLRLWGGGRNEIALPPK